MCNDASFEFFVCETAQGMVGTARFESADLLVVFAFEEEMDFWFRGLLTFIWSTDER